MTDMPGNPYTEALITSLHTAASLQDSQSLDLEKIEHALIAVAEATAALAYEQRTANLLEFMRHAKEEGNIDGACDLNNMVAGRMGLREDH